MHAKQLDGQSHFVRPWLNEMALAERGCSGAGKHRRRMALMQMRGESFMEETVYSVSEAVRLVGVESHVLRYWEEELGISIQRTSQGHRIYSDQDIQMFCRVKEWKQNGLQLKAIRRLLENSDAAGEKTEFDEQLWSAACGSSKRTAENESSSDETAESTYEIIPAQETKGNLEKIIFILKQMMEEVVEEQNKKLEQQITEQLREELENLYLQYIQALQEASAAREQEKERSGMIRQLLRRLFPGK